MNKTNNSVFRKLPTKVWSDSFGSGDYVDRDYGYWQFSCEAGEYTTDSLFKLIYAIFKHRFSHFLQGNGFKD
jgi:hypothetical protein